MAKDNTEFSMFDGAFGESGDTFSTIPIQTLPDSQKTKPWKKATVDSIERHGINQIRENMVFREWKAMSEGRFTYLGTGISDFQELPWFDKEIRKLRQDSNIDTYIKHFDFIGIVVNAISGAYNDLDDRYRVESIDEYSTNEYIREKTQLLHQYAQQSFKAEIEKLLTMKGIDPNKDDFQSEEEAQQYQQQVQEQIKIMTPEEIENNLSKNFKVLATEWAQNVLTADKKRFHLESKDKDCFVEMLLTGRFFRHYRIAHDTYEIEHWKAEETFFSQDYDIEFPQNAEFVGRVFDISPSSILARYGHKMNIKQQERIGNYWNQEKGNYQRYSAGALKERKKRNPEEMLFPEPVVSPWHNYFDHQVNVQLEDALGVPLGTTTYIDEDGDENSFSSWIPREELGDGEINTGMSKYLRDDIRVRRDTVRVTEGYFRSQKRLAILIRETDLGTMSIELVTDDLLSDFLEEEEIKKLNSVSIKELQKALSKGNIKEYKDTITYIYTPEIWSFIKIRGNGSTIKEDMYLDVKPLDFQIKGESDMFDVLIPVSGYIGTGITPKLEPYQQLHNIAMNQITELLEKELGVFFTFDIMSLGDEYQDETTEEAIYRIRENIKDTGMFGLDLSRQNTSAQTPNIFQKHDVVYATQVQYRWELAQQYKQEGLNQLGITPQMLGQPNTYVTAEGVKQGAQASFALLDVWFDRMSIAKSKGMNIQLAIAQFCEAEGISNNTLTRKGDGELSFIDIMKQDGELFPLRNLSVYPESSSSERKKIETIKQFMLNDNTIDRSMNDVIEILTNPVLVEIQQKAKKMELDSERKTREAREFESSQLDKQLEAQAQSDSTKHEREKELAHIEGRYKLLAEEIDSLGRAADKESNTEGMDAIRQSTKDAIQSQQKERELDIKEEDLNNKQINEADRKKIELKKLAQKSEELRLKNKQLNIQQQGNIINKN